MDIDNFSNEELENFYKTIGSNVKKYRKEKGISQQELAFLIGHNSVGYISKGELYKYNKTFNLKQLFQISKVLNCKVEDLVRID